MNLKQLRYFCATFETGSTTLAAQRCHVSQSVISAAIAQLEQDLGCRLFERHARGLSPSPDGVNLHRQARALLADADRLTDSFRQRACGPRELRLHVHRTLSAGLVRTFVQRWLSISPEVTLTLVGEPEDADASLTTQDCASPAHPFTPLWPEQYMLLLPTNHALQAQAHLSLQHLTDQPLIERVQCERATIWHHQLALSGVRPKVVARVDSEEWALELVASGLGITVAPVGPQPRRNDLIYRADVTELRLTHRVVGLSPRSPSVSDMLPLLLSHVAAINFGQDQRPDHVRPYNAVARGPLAQSVRAEDS